MARPELSGPIPWLWSAAGAGLLVALTVATHHPARAPQCLPQSAPMAAPAERLILPKGAWNDPSVPPEALKKAYAPLSHPLPPEARPQPSNIHPPEAKERRIQRRVKQGDLVIY